MNRWWPRPPPGRRSARISLSQREGGLHGLAYYAAPAQPDAGIGGIRLEPGTRAAQPEGVAPGIHVGQHAVATQREFVGQQNLQVADGALLVVIAAGVAVEARTARGAHADVMAELVQQRMQRRVGADEEFVAAQPRLALAPVGAGQR